VKRDYDETAFCALRITNVAGNVTKFKKQISGKMNHAI